MSLQTGNQTIEVPHDKKLFQEKCEMLYPKN